MSQDDDNNHADQCNPNNDAYWQSRGEDERPDDWEDRTGGEQSWDDEPDNDDDSLFCC